MIEVRSSTVRIDGVKEVIRELNRLDEEIRRSFRKNVRTILKPAIDDAKNTYRNTDYPSGTARNWQQNGRQKFPLDGSQAASATRSSIKTSKKNTSTLLIVNTNAGAAIYEFANTGSLGAAFRKKNGHPARTLWPSTERHLPGIVQEMTDVIEQVEQLIESRIR